MLRISLRCLALVAAVASIVTPAAAQSFAHRVEQGSSHRYEIRNSFGPTMHQPSEGNFRTAGELVFDTTAFASAVDDSRLILVFRIDAVRFEFIDDDGSRVSGLQFNSADPEETDLTNPAGPLRRIVGETFEVLIEEGGAVTPLRDTFTRILPQDSVGAVVARLVSEGMLETSIRWIFDLPPRSQAAATGSSFTDEVVVRFTGDGRVEFAPEFTVDAVEGEAATLRIGGEVAYVDDRSPNSIVGGREPFAIDEATLEGEAVWDLEIGALRSLDLRTYAKVEPANIDPLGRRIEQRSIEQVFTIRRLDADAAVSR